MLASSGCGACPFEDQCFPACATAEDCSDGHVCAVVAGYQYAGGIPGEPGSPTRCTIACSSTTDCAANAESECGCPESETQGVCDGALAEGAVTTVQVPVCRLDYDAARACERLCACVCWHDECEADLTYNGCLNECAAAYDEFPDCSKELDDYYYCGHRYSVCKDRTGLSHIPTEFNPPLSETCGPSLTALAACTKAPWKSFFPSKSGF